VYGYSMRRRRRRGVDVYGYSIRMRSMCTGTHRGGGQYVRIHIEGEEGEEGVDEYGCTTTRRRRRRRSRRSRRRRRRRMRSMCTLRGGCVSTRPRPGLLCEVVREPELVGVALRVDQRARPGARLRQPRQHPGPHLGRFQFKLSIVEPSLDTY